MKATRKKRTGLLITVFVVAAVLLLLAVGQTGRRQAAQVAVASVGRQDLTTSVSSNGKVEPIEPSIVAAKLAAFIEKVSVVEGQSVARGSLLLTLDATDARAELARLREELAAAEEELRTAQGGGPAGELAQMQSDQTKAEAELRRLRQERDVLERLAAKQAATRTELDQNRLAIEQTEAELRLAREKREALARRAKFDFEHASLRTQHNREAIRVLEEKVSAAQVRAPVSGVLYSLAARAGSFVQVGETLAELADLSRVRVRAFVDEPDLGRLEKDQEVEITWDAYPDRIWKGKLERVPKSVVARGTRSVGEALCSVDNQGLELLPNVNVNVRILVRRLADALVVPREAVRAEEGHFEVFVVAGGKLQRREIKVGTVSPTSYQVLEGLSEGDQVALSGDAELRDGLEVRVTEQE